MKKSTSGIKRIIDSLKVVFVLLLLYYLFYINVDIKKALYPIKYETIVEEYSKEYKIDPLMIYSLIKVESSFDETAKSNKGAMGLMQITPSTGEWIAQKLKLEKFNTEDLFLPEINIMMGTWYFNYLTDKFKGDMNLAIAAYNAGPGNVQNWLSNEKYSNDGRNLSQIPYKETENYLRKITNAYEQYKELYKISE